MKPILYSFRRCPYAMRARLALHHTGIQVELREVALRNKPAALLLASAKGSVPVLVLEKGEVIDESLDIMVWALNHANKQQANSTDWLAADQTALFALITENDHVFKSWLDRYKYSDRFPEYSQTYYRQQGELFLRQLENKLHQHRFLLSHHAGLADYAIFPFVRQFAYVDKAWFDAAPYPKLQHWLQYHLDSEYFSAIMVKQSLWLAD